MKVKIKVEKPEASCFLPPSARSPSFSRSPPSPGVRRLTIRPRPPRISGAIAAGPRSAGSRLG